MTYSADRLNRTAWAWEYQGLRGEDLLVYMDECIDAKDADLEPFALIVMKAQDDGIGAAREMAVDGIANKYAARATLYAQQTGDFEYALNQGTTWAMALDFTGFADMLIWYDGLDIDTGETIDDHIQLAARTAGGTSKFCFTTALASYGALRGVGRAMSLGSKARPPETGTSRTVIGKLKDLKNLGSGENTLLKHLPDRGTPRLNWQQNSSVLRTEMGKGLPLRGASVDHVGNLINNTGFLRAERALLQQHGWMYNPQTRLWSPPAAN